MAASAAAAILLALCLLLAMNMTVLHTNLPSHSRELPAPPPAARRPAPRLRTPSPPVTARPARRESTAPPRGSAATIRPPPPWTPPSTAAARRESAVTARVSSSAPTTTPAPAARRRRPRYTVVFAGLCKDCTLALPGLLGALDRVACGFERAHLVVMESNSKDGSASAGVRARPCRVQPQCQPTAQAYARRPASLHVPTSPSAPRRPLVAPTAPPTGAHPAAAPRRAARPTVSAASCHLRTRRRLRAAARPAGVR